MNHKMVQAEDISRHGSITLVGRTSPGGSIKLSLITPTGVVMGNASCEVYMSLDGVSVLSGSGTPLFGEHDNPHVSLEPIETIQTPEVIHL